MVVSFALGVLLAKHVGQGASVSYENAGASVARILNDLGAATNTKLEAAPETGNEVLCVRCLGENLSTVMQRIAWAVDGTWKPSGDGFRLIRTGDQLRDETEREYQLKVRMYDRGLSQLRDALNRQSEFTAENAETMVRRNWLADGDHAEVRPIILDTPASRAIERMSIDIDPYDVAEVPASGRVVFALHPTHAQRSLSDAQLRDLRGFVSEQAIWSSILAKAHRQNPDFRPEFTGPLSVPVPESKIANVWLILTKSTHDLSPVHAELRFLDAKGGLLGLSANTISCDTGPVLQSVRSSRGPSGQPFPLPEDVSLISQIIERRSVPAAQGGPIWELLAHPEATEPLSLTIGKLLVLTAKSANKPLVANLADDYFNLSMPNRVLPDTLFDLLSFRFAERNKDSDWIGIRSVMPVRARNLRANRFALGSFLRRSQKTEPPTMAEVAEFYRDLPDLYQAALPGLLLNAVAPHATIHAEDQPFLKMFAQLPKDIQEAAEVSGIRAADLPNDALDTLNNILFSSTTSLQLTPEPNHPAMDWTFYLGTGREPTLAFPEGVPLQSTIFIRPSSGLAVDPQHGDNRMFTGGMGASELAWMKFMQDRPDIFRNAGGGGNQISLANLVVGVKSTYHFNIRLSPELVLDHACQNAVYATDKTVALKDLPADFQKQFKDTYDQYVQSYQNIRPGDWRNRNSGPPPP